VVEEEQQMVGFEILDSTERHWRLLDSVIVPSNAYPTPSELIVARGVIYIHLSNNTILRIDGYSEEWRIISTPVEAITYSSNTLTRLIKHRGRLGFASKLTQGVWDYWVQSSDDVWVKLGANDVSESWDINDGRLSFFKGNNMHTCMDVGTTCVVYSYRSDLEPVNLYGCTLP